MIVHQVENGYLIVLKRGQKLLKSLTNFCTEHKIQAAWVQGLGAVQGATVGYFHLPSRKYKFKNLTKFLELVSLTGNISLVEGKPWPHLHVVLSDSKLRTYGGHLKEATVGGTCEIYLRPYKVKLERQTDPKTGLNLIK